MKKQRKNAFSFRALASVLITASSIFLPASARPASPIENIMNVPVDAVFYNACCDEEVYFTGTAHFVLNKNVIHLNIADVTGVGLSTGYEYVSIGSQVNNNIKYTSTEEGTLVSRFNMRNEDGCSFKMIITFHINVNANGDVTSIFFTTETQCL